MQQYKPHISALKKQRVEDIKKILLDAKIICIIDLLSLPSKTLQSLRNKKRDKFQIVVPKKRVLKIAIQEIKAQKDLTAVLPYLDKAVPALLITEESPFAIYKLIKQSKTPAPAKAGQIAPKDLIVEPGPTNFPPGPIIGELGQAGIIASVEAGKVTIKKTSTIAREGQVITQKQSEVLAKLGIQPMEIGLNIIAAYDGTLYERAILDVDEKQYLNNLRQAIRDALNLTMSIGYVTKDNIKPLISKAARQAKHLSEKHNILTSENIKEEVKTAEKAALKIKEKVPEITEAKEEVKEPVQETHVQEQAPQEQPQENKEQQRPKQNQDTRKNLQKSIYSEEDAKKAQEIIDAMKDKDIKQRESKSRR